MAKSIHFIEIMEYLLLISSYKTLQSYNIFPEEEKELSSSSVVFLLILCGPFVRRENYDGLEPTCLCFAVHSTSILAFIPFQNIKRFKTIVFVTNGYKLC